MVAHVSSGTLSRILVVEDDASLAESIVGGLADAGFAVAHTPDDDVSWEALQSGVWDHMILDW
ncbi:MAG: hypothetical protein ACLQGP_02245 [Isosphaeraceae bacterium]